MLATPDSGTSPSVGSRSLRGVSAFSVSEASELEALARRDFSARLSRLESSSHRVVFRIGGGGLELVLFGVVGRSSRGLVFMTSSSRRPFGIESLSVGDSCGASTSWWDLSTERKDSGRMIARDEIRQAEQRQDSRLL